MKIKIQKKKFLRNILIGIIALLVVAFIINIAPGYKRNKYKDVTNLVIGDENVTEKLLKPIYKDEDGNIYISKDDIKNLIDKTIYFNEENNMIIATSKVSVESMDLAIIKDGIVYIPIEEMEGVYNIKVDYLENEDILIIDNLNDGMIKAEALKDTAIRYKQRSLSKKVGTLEEGEVVSAFYTTSKGWRLIRTDKGIVGYVKANTLTNEFILRQDMEQDIQTKTIAVDINDGSVLNIEDQKIVVKDLLEVTEEGILIKNTSIDNSTNENIWANITVKEIDLSDYENRCKIIKNIASVCRKNEISGVNVILTDNKDMERFVIELAPRLREVGIMTNIVTDNKIDEGIYTDIVNYIITK